MGTQASQVAPVVKNPPVNAGDIKDMGSIPGSGRSSGEGNGSPCQYSYLENPMDRGAWQGTAHRITKSRTWLERLNTHVCVHGLRYPFSALGTVHAPQHAHLRARTHTHTHSYWSNATPSTLWATIIRKTMTQSKLSMFCQCQWLSFLQNCSNST